MTNREAIGLFKAGIYAKREKIKYNKAFFPKQDNEQLEQDIEVYEKAIDALEKAEEQQWIPVTEELPEDYVKVLVTVSGSFDVFEFDNAVEVGGWGCDGWYICDYEEWKNPNVTAWMPFPKSYKARTEMPAVKEE